MILLISGDQSLSPIIPPIAARAESVENASRLLKVIQSELRIDPAEIVGVIRIPNKFPASVCAVYCLAGSLLNCVNECGFPIPIPIVAMNVEQVLLISLALISLAPAILSIRTCGSHEVCVSKKKCDESDDSGKGKLVKRILDNSCGRDLECCDREQLENFEAYQAEIEYRNQRRKNIWASSDNPLEGEPKPNLVGAKEDEPGYKSCGVKRECVPRHLCSTGVVNEDGRYIIKPRINEESNFGCRVVEECCPLGDQVRNQIRSYITIV